MVSFVKFVFYTALTLITLLGLAVLAVALIIVNGNANFAVMSPSGDYKIEAVPAFPLFVGWERAYMRFTEVAHPENLYRSPMTFDGSMDFGSIFNSDAKVFMFPFIFDRQTKHFSADDAGAINDSWMSIFTSNTPTDISH